MRNHSSTVYLDSSDYSRLSDPKRPPAMEQLRIRLLEQAAQGKANFAFSGIHISEMAPIAAGFTSAAAARTDLLVQFCKRNTMISFDRLIELEFAKLSNRDEEIITAMTADGTWFPDIGQVVTPVQSIVNFAKIFDEKALEMGLNRHARRMLKQKTTKQGQLRSGFLSSVGDLDLSSILESYPMRKEDSEVLMRYTIGKATEHQANEAFLESLRDPSWMMRWFYEHHDRLGVIGDWVRRPASDMVEVTVKLAEQAKLAMDYKDVTGLDVTGGMLSSSGWKSAQDNFLLNIANRILANKHPLATPCADADSIDRYCPGMAMCIRVTHSSMRNSIGDDARKPSKSDFVDAVHAMYAPYVDFFHSDRYMSPIIQKHSERYGTIVVPKLEDLPEQIDKRFTIKSSQ